MGKVLILAGSVRRGGNTELLAEAFAKGASKHNQVEIVSVAEYKVNPCIGCDACFTREGNSCCQNDDMAKVYEKLGKADVVVIASPVYFYGLSAQLKALIDRLHNPIRNTFRIKKFALLLVGGAAIPELFDSIKVQYRLMLKVFNSEDAGMVLVNGVREKGSIKEHEALEEAYRLGESLK